MRLALIGTGTMGERMGRRLLDAGRGDLDFSAVEAEGPPGG